LKIHQFCLNPLGLVEKEKEEMKEKEAQWLRSNSYGVSQTGLQVVA